MGSSSAHVALAEQDLVVVVQQQLDHERRLSGGKGFLNVIVHVGVHVSEASLAKVNVDNAFLAGFAICESLLSNLLCRSRHDHHIWTSPKTCLCCRGPWNGILVDRTYRDVNERHSLDVAVGSESAIGLLR